MQNMTFDNYDKLGRKQFAESLTKAISRFAPLSEGAYVLSLNAPYGSGKTTFLSMWRNALTAEKYKVVYINAWETDFDEEPLVPIISKLLDSLPKAEKAEKAKAAMKEVLVAGAIMGNQVLAHVTGANVYEASDEAKKELNIQKVGQELYKAFEFKQNANKHLKKQLGAYAAELPNKPLIIMVDELDRVRPDYAVKFLEAIKHIFSIQNVCFVLAVDRVQLEKSVKQLYGDIDFENYYLRFVTREATLQIDEKINREDYVNSLWEKFIEEPEKRGAIFSFDARIKNSIRSTLVSISYAFKFLPRQIEKLFNVFAHLMAISNDKKTNSESWVDAAIVLIAIYIDNPPLYKKLGEGNLLSTELLDYLSKLYVMQHSESDTEWLKIIAIAFNTTVDDHVIKNSIKAYATLKGYNLDTTDDRGKAQIKQELERVYDQQGRFGYGSGFKSIYSRLEEWRSFIG